MSTEPSLITLPSGDHDLAKNPIVVSRSDVVVDLSAATLVCKPPFPPVFNPIVVKSVRRRFVKAPARDESRLSGEVVAGETDRLVMTESWPDPPQPGEKVRVMCGVKTDDPAEYADDAVMTVDRVEGNALIFTTAFPRSVKVYATEADLRAAVSDPNEYKIGPWGERRNTNFGKGLGLDHGLRRYVGGMVSNVTVVGAKFETELPPLPDAPKGGQYLQVQDATNVSVQGFSAVNSCTSMVLHGWYSDDLTFEGVTVRGEAVCKSNEGKLDLCKVFDLWGGRRITYRGFDVRGANLALFASEISPSDVLLEDGYFASPVGGRGQVVNAYGAVFGDYRMRNVRFGQLTGPVGTQVQQKLFASLGRFPDMEDCKLSPDDGTLEGDVPLHVLRFFGTTRVFGRDFAPTERHTTVVKVPMGKDVTFVMPAGLYRACSYRFLDLPEQPTLMQPPLALPNAAGWVLVGGKGGSEPELLSLKGPWEKYLARQDHRWRWTANTRGVALVQFEYELAPLVGGPGWTGCEVVHDRVIAVR